MYRYPPPTPPYPPGIVVINILSIVLINMLFIYSRGNEAI